MKDELKEIYISLSRAIEDGDDLRLGIVIGQVLCKIKDIINETNGEAGGVLGDTIL